MRTPYGCMASAHLDCQGGSVAGGLGPVFRGNFSKPGRPFKPKRFLIAMPCSKRQMPNATRHRHNVSPLLITHAFSRRLSKPSINWEWHARNERPSCSISC